jgi:hypothetical protein
MVVLWRDGFQRFGRGLARRGFMDRVNVTFFSLAVVAVVRLLQLQLATFET